MFEKSKEQLLSKKQFLIRLLWSSVFAVCIVFLALYVGMCGYHFTEGMSWIDAFVNAAMILSGMGPLTPLLTNAGKIFAGVYALFSGLAFILIVSIILAPILHRFFHKFHLETDEDEKNI